MATDINFTFLLIGFLPIALYALGGLWDAVNKGEKVNWPSFIKTLVVGLVTAGAISTQTADIINELAATTAVSLTLDKLLNSIMKKRDEPKEPLPPPPAPPPGP